MSKDKAGRKFNRIKIYTRVVRGKTQVVKGHIRSNRNKK